MKLGIFVLLFFTSQVFGEQFLYVSENLDMIGPGSEICKYCYSVAEPNFEISYSKEELKLLNERNRKIIEPCIEEFSTLNSIVHQNKKEYSENIVQNIEYQILFSECNRKLEGNHNHDVEACLKPPGYLCIGNFDVNGCAQRILKDYCDIDFTNDTIRFLIMQISYCMKLDLDF
ncbi:unnamed protein product [Caenorhabditis angaria]|uniref:DUF19 domain-containing protein n=1 Tax=Caenorhabditis angaria TaxID=860376 RepID=A0A9P1NCL1_9PELO|nr:unnamed protein product [Caenorhabditis angaria]